MRQALAKRIPRLEYRLLLSAHGLPKRVIARGDPYQGQVEKTAAAIVARSVPKISIGRSAIRAVSVRSNGSGRRRMRKSVAPAHDGKALIVVPIAFVSEHSETLVELDIEYAKLAKESGVPDYIRVPTVSTHAEFIDGLARLVLQAAERNAHGRPICQRHFQCFG